MFYFLWFTLTIAASMIAVITGLWFDRVLTEKNQ